MSNPSPEALAKEFARRWFSRESAVMRELGEKELVEVMRRVAVAASTQRDIQEKAA